MLNVTLTTLTSQSQGSTVSDWTSTKSVWEKPRWGEWKTHEQRDREDGGLAERHPPILLELSPWTDLVWPWPPSLYCSHLTWHAVADYPHLHPLVPVPSRFHNKQVETLTRTLACALPAPPVYPSFYFCFSLPAGRIYDVRQVNFQSLD